MKRKENGRRNNEIKIECVQRGEEIGEERVTKRGRERREERKRKKGEKNDQ